MATLAVPAVRVSFTRAGMPQATVTFPIVADERMIGYGAGLAHDAIVSALMREDHTHPREREDYASAWIATYSGASDDRTRVYYSGSN